MYYLNGQLIGQRSDMVSPLNVKRSNCYFGKSNWDGNALADADLDEIKIFNRTLSTEEILEEYQNRFPILTKIN